MGAERSLNSMDIKAIYNGLHQALIFFPSSNTEIAHYQSSNRRRVITREKPEAMAIISH